jgi:tetratricopeptide (TPR) repeat protein
VTARPLLPAAREACAAVDGEPAAALGERHQGPALCPADAAAQCLMGRACLQKGMARGALEHFARAAASDPPNLTAATELAALLFEHGYKREGLSLIDDVLRRAPSDPRTGELTAMRKSRAVTLSVVSIHQPSYLPWLGYLHKIYYSDRFVVLDDVKFSKNSFIKRVLVKKRDDQKEAAYLSVPLRKHSDFAKISELNCADGEDWRAEHLRKIAAAYRTTPFFKEIFPALEAAFAATRGDTTLVGITGTLVVHMLKLLKIERPMIQSSRVAECGAILDAHDRNMALVKHLGGNVYLSGSVARDYQEGRPLPDNVKLIYQDFWNFVEGAPYVPPERFANGLSAMDALFNVGPAGVLEMFERYENPLVTRGHLFPEQAASPDQVGAEPSLGTAG